MMFFWFIIIGVLIYFLMNGNIDLKTFQSKSAQNHLDERLAKGEISIQEYRDLIAAIKSK